MLLNHFSDKEAELKSVLERKQAEMLQIEESYGTLQEEVTGLNKKLKKVLSRVWSVDAFYSNHFFAGPQLHGRRKERLERHAK